MRYLFPLLVVSCITFGCSKSGGSNVTNGSDPYLILYGELEIPGLPVDYFDFWHAVYTNDTANHTLTIYANNGTNMLLFSVPYHSDTISYSDTISAVPYPIADSGYLINLGAFTWSIDSAAGGYVSFFFNSWKGDTLIGTVKGRMKANYRYADYWGGFTLSLTLPKVSPSTADSIYSNPNGE